jgi:hypothetical protein
VNLSFICNEKPIKSSILDDVHGGRTGFQDAAGYGQMVCQLGRTNLWYFIIKRGEDGVSSTPATHKGARILVFRGYLNETVCHLNQS